jgi:hypothetical protein
MYDNRVLTPAELAAYLRVPTGWLNANYRELGLASVTVGPARRFLMSDVADWLEDQRDQE